MVPAPFAIYFPNYELKIALHCTFVFAKTQNKINYILYPIFSHYAVYFCKCFALPNYTSNFRHTILGSRDQTCINQRVRDGYASRENSTITSRCKGCSYSPYHRVTYHLSMVPQSLHWQGVTGELPRKQELVVGLNLILPLGNIGF